MGFGIPIGVLIGILTGMLSLVVFNVLLAATILNANALLSLVGYLSGIPTFWFGGPWLATELFKLVPLEEFIFPYVLSLMVSFILIVGYPFMRWIIKLGQ
jgi:hypothetical protein